MKHFWKGTTSRIPVLLMMAIFASCGAAVVALVGGLVFIPALGLGATAWTVVLLEAAALAGVAFALLRGER